MTSFSVEWQPDILGDLADIWVQSPDRQAVTAAEAKIDHLLSQDPLRHGRHLSGGLYRLDVPPLIVTYSIDWTRHHVVIESVRRPA